MDKPIKTNDMKTRFLDNDGKLLCEVDEDIQLCLGDDVQILEDEDALNVIALQYEIHSNTMVYWIGHESDILLRKSIYETT